MPEYLVKWPHLISGTLIRRYKRFMADVRLDNGEVVTVHCPNSGRMLGCSEPGRKVYLSRSDNLKRKFIYTWELIEMPSSLVVVNTLIANKVVKKAIQLGQIDEISGYNTIRSEVMYGHSSRVDLLLEGQSHEKCYVEIKSCTLSEDHIIMFPDAVTSRGLKHLRELECQVRAGDRSILFFLVQRMDGLSFRPADHIDPLYGKELRYARDSGVEILVYTTHITATGIMIGEKIPVSFP